MFFVYFCPFLFGNEVDTKLTFNFHFLSIWQKIILLLSNAAKEITSLAANHVLKASVDIIISVLIE